MNQSIKPRALALRDVGAEQRLNFQAAFQVILLFFIVVEGLMGLRVVLKIVGANPDVPFARFIYSASGLFLAPFANLVGSPSAGGVVLQVPSLIAMLLYGVVAWLILLVVWPLFERPTTTRRATYDRYRR